MKFDIMSTKEPFKYFNFDSSNSDIFNNSILHEYFIVFLQHQCPDSKNSSVYDICCDDVNRELIFHTTKLACQPLINRENQKSSVLTKYHCSYDEFRIFLSKRNWTVSPIM